MLLILLAAAPDAAANSQGVTDPQIANVLQALAIFFGLIGVAVSIFWSSVIAGKRATLDLILSEMLDPRQVDMRAKFTTLRDAGNIVKFAHSPDADTDDASIIAAILNIYEMIAIGIHKKIIDEKSYKDWARTTFVKDWRECKSYVTELRKSSSTPTFYCEFEKLAIKWATEEEKRFC